MQQLDLTFSRLPRSKPRSVCTIQYIEERGSEIKHLKIVFYLQKIHILTYIFSSGYVSTSEKGFTLWTCLWFTGTGAVETHSFILRPRPRDLYPLVPRQSNISPKISTHVRSMAKLSCVEAFSDWTIFDEARGQKNIV